MAEKKTRPRTVWPSKGGQNLEYQIKVRPPPPPPQVRGGSLHKSTGTFVYDDDDCQQERPVEILVCVECDHPTKEHPKTGTYEKLTCSHAYCHCPEHFDDGIDCRQ